MSRSPLPKGVGLSRTATRTQRPRAGVPKRRPRLFAKAVHQVGPSTKRVYLVNLSILSLLHQPHLEHQTSSCFKLNVAPRCVVLLTRQEAEQPFDTHKWHNETMLAESSCATMKAPNCAFGQPSSVLQDGQRQRGLLKLFNCTV